MRSLRLQAVTDVDFGELGLKFVIPHKMCNGRFTITSGFTLAHDIIEHQQGHQKIGSIGDEMIALGGVCYARGQWGKIREDNFSIFSPEEDIASDLTGQMANLYFDRHIPFRQKLVQSRKQDPSGFVDRVVEEARSNFHKDYDDYEDMPSQDRIDSYLEACRTYMLHGSKLAERRFGSGILANEMFWQIAETTKRHIQRLEFEGQEFLLRYDFNKNVTFEEVRAEDHD